MAVLCDYCRQEAALCTGQSVYKRKALDHLLFWKCEPCEAWVGCYPETYVPLGSLAKQDLRDARRATHTLFDAMWKGGDMTRRGAYAWLAERMQLPHHMCHIGMFSIEQCWRAQQLLKRVS